MSLPKTILVPTDFGDASEAALDQALELAKALKADVVLLHCFEIPLVGFPDGAMVVTAELTDRIVQGAQSALDEAVQARKGSGVSLRPLLKQGDPWRTALAVAEEVGAGLIVMGTHGRRGLPRALIGSVAEKLVRTSPVPVMSVHAPVVSEGQIAAGERTVRSTAAFG